MWGQGHGEGCLPKRQVWTWVTSRSKSEGLCTWPGLWWLRFTLSGTITSLPHPQPAVCALLPLNLRVLQLPASGEAWNEAEEARTVFKSSGFWVLLLFTFCLVLTVLLTHFQNDKPLTIPTDFLYRLPWAGNSILARKAFHKDVYCAVGRRCYLSSRKKTQRARVCWRVNANLIILSGKLLETTVKGALWHFGCKYYTYYKRSVFYKAVGIRAQLCTEGFGYMSNYQKPSKKQK